jgi:preprotein translocase SecE subunit
MEQKNENIANDQNEKKESKKKAAAKKKKASFAEIVADHKAELKKIVWPKPAETGKKTVMVIIVSLFIGGVIFCMDTVFTGLQSLVINLLS